MCVKLTCRAHLYWNLPEVPAVELRDVLWSRAVPGRDAGSGRSTRLDPPAGSQPRSHCPQLFRCPELDWASVLNFRANSSVYLLLQAQHRSDFSGVSRKWAKGCHRTQVPHGADHPQEPRVSSPVRKAHIGDAVTPGGPAVRSHANALRVRVVHYDLVRVVE